MATVFSGCHKYSSVQKSKLEIYDNLADDVVYSCQGQNVFFQILIKQGGYNISFVYKAII